MARFTLIAAAAFGFLLTIAFANLLVPVLHAIYGGKKRKGVSWQAYDGALPTMGGLCVILASMLSLGVVGSALLLAEPILVKMNWTSQTELVVWSAFAVGAVGFVDDILKNRAKTKAGMPSVFKWGALFVVVGVMLYVFNSRGLITPTVVLPVVGLVNLGNAYLPLLLITAVVFVRSVEISDGVNGLCGSTIFLILLSLCTIAVLINRFEIAIFPSALAGALLAFLFWNFPPAKIALGSTGSFFLAGAVFGIIQVLNWPGMLVLIALPFWVEAIAVFLQRVSIKVFHKKLFAKAPLHSFLLEQGISQVTVIYIFCALTLAGIFFTMMFMRLGGAI